MFKCGNSIIYGLELPMLQITFLVIELVLFHIPFPLGNDLGILGILAMGKEDMEKKKAWKHLCAG